MVLIPVILSGGSGTRLWPMSRTARPKQFARVVGDRSLIQETVLRAEAVPDAGPPIVVGSAERVDLVRAHLGEIGVMPSRIVAEPVGRNTAPAIAAAAATVDPADLLLVLPSDAAMPDTEAFVSAVVTGLEPAADGRLVTFGVLPDRPETGYGYIEASDPGGAWSPVARFVEKPDAATAEQYLASGGFSWNAGIFLFRAEAYLSELRAHAPDVARAALASVEDATVEGDLLIPGQAFSESPSISIDHAVMEHTDRAAVVPLDAGWSDVGSWRALWDLDADAPGDNVVSGNALVRETTGSLVMGSDRLVAVLGVEDLVIVDTEDAVLVTTKEHAQAIRALVEEVPDHLR